VNLLLYEYIRFGWMMEFKKTAMVALLVVGIGFSGASQASLVDRGNGLLYDNVLNVTWLQDANYAKTSGYSVTGMMDWASANTWATNLNYQGLTGWRLANITPVNGTSFNVNFSFNGTTDLGYNIISPYSELAYMYHVNLGLKDEFNTAGAFQADFGIFGNGTYFNGQNNVGLVRNLQSYMYWSGADYSPYNSPYAWSLMTTDGQQSYGNGKNSLLYAWAVRPGDVSAVPVPAAIWLFTSGLGLLAFNRRRKYLNSIRLN
jgi:hypothetical protein